MSRPSTELPQRSLEQSTRGFDAIDALIARTERPGQGKVTREAFVHTFSLFAMQARSRYVNSSDLDLRIEKAKQFIEKRSHESGEYKFEMAQTVRALALLREDASGTEIRKDLEVLTSVNKRFGHEVVALNHAYAEFVESL